MTMTADQEKAFFRAAQFTFKGRIFHPALLAPKPNKEGTKINYNVMFAFKPGENAEVLAKLNEFLTTVYNTWYPTVPMQFFVNPLKKFETYQRMNGQPNAEYLRGHYWFNAATGIAVPPQVVKQGPMGTFIALTEMDEAECYSGRNAVTQVSFYKIKEKKQGLSTNVNAVLLLEGGDKEAGFAQMNPAEVFGSFVTDSRPAQGFGGPQQPQNAPAQGTNNNYQYPLPQQPQNAPAQGTNNNYQYPLPQQPQQPIPNQYVPQQQQQYPTQPVNPGFV